MENIKNVYNNIAEGWHHLHQKPNKFLNVCIDWKGKVLDLGCGNAKDFLVFKNNNVELIGVDSSENMLKFAVNFCKKHELNAKFFCEDIRKTHFHDNEFDYVICFGVLHHFNKEEQIKVLTEAKRILKTNGEIIISVFNHDWEKIKNKPRETKLSWKHKGKIYYRYYYLFEKPELRELLEKNEFIIEKDLSDEKNIVFLCKSSNDF